jgi:hypothetical protein
VQVTLTCLLITVFLISTFIVSASDSHSSNPLDSFTPSLNWTTKWWLSLFLSPPSLRQPSAACPLCAFTPTQINSSSTISDAVIIVTMGEIYDLPTTIRSMRTAGVNSALVVLADSAAAELIRMSISHVIQSCGVVLVDVGSLMAHHLKGRYRTRWHLVYDYLRLNPFKFKRFTMTDAYDSFFQGDVFLGSVRDDTLYFSTESLPVHKCPHSSGWIQEIYPKAIKKFGHLPIICAGPVVGGVEPLLRLYDIMFAMPEWSSHWDKPPDQAYVNVVMRMRYLEKGGIPYEVVANDRLLTTVGYCDWTGN